jgi:hypothetical protein
MVPPMEAAIIRKVLRKGTKNRPKMKLGIPDWNTRTLSPLPSSIKVILDEWLCAGR